MYREKKRISPPFPAIETDFSDDCPLKLKGIDVVVFRRVGQDCATRDGKSAKGGESGSKSIAPDGAQGAALQSRCEALLGERKAMQARVTGDIRSANSEQHIAAEHYIYSSSIRNA